MGRIGPFDAVFQHLSTTAFCNPNVDSIRSLQSRATDACSGETIDSYTFMPWLRSS